MRKRSLSGCFPILRTRTPRRLQAERVQKTPEGSQWLLQNLPDGPDCGQPLHTGAALWLIPRHGTGSIAISQNSSSGPPNISECVQFRSASGRPMVTVFRSPASLLAMPISAIKRTWQLRYESMSEFVIHLAEALHSTRARPGVSVPRRLSAGAG